MIPTPHPERDQISSLFSPPCACSLLLMPSVGSQLPVVVAAMLGVEKLLKMRLHPPPRGGAESLSVGLGFFLQGEVGF